MVAYELSFHHWTTDTMIRLSGCPDFFLLLAGHTVYCMGFVSYGDTIERYVLVKILYESYSKYIHYIEIICTSRHFKFR